MFKLPVVKNIKKTTVFIIIVSISLFTFSAGMVSARISTTKRLESLKSTSFSPKKLNRPELSFFLTSFCPQSNEIEQSLRSVYDLVRTDADFTPHYLFQKTTDINTFCLNHKGNPKYCPKYVESKHFKDIAECQKTVSKNLSACLSPNNFLRSATGVYYTSILGRQELNQNVREICAWNSSSDKTKWWNFISAVNKNCTPQNSDSCWEEQALKAGLTPNSITDCFNKNAFSIIESEILHAQKFQVQGTPAIVINDSVFPPSGPQAWLNGNGHIIIAKNTIPETQYRQPNTLKLAVCSAFKRQPNNCKTTLPAIDSLSFDNKGCSNL